MPAGGSGRRPVVLAVHRLPPTGSYPVSTRPARSSSALLRDRRIDALGHDVGLAVDVAVQGVVVEAELGLDRGEAERLLHPSR